MFKQTKQKGERKERRGETGVHEWHHSYSLHFPAIFRSVAGTSDAQLLTHSTCGQSQTRDKDLNISLPVYKNALHERSQRGS